MNPLPMSVLQSGSKLLLLLICLLTAACTPQKSPNNSTTLSRPYLPTANSVAVFDATFEYKDFLASGLLVMKKLDKATYHVVLLSKFGPAIMEFKLLEGGIEWIKTFEQLNKKSVEKLLEQDFRLLLLTMLEDPERVRPVKSTGEGLSYNVKSGLKARLRLDPQTKRVLYAENRKTFNPVKTKVYFEYGEGDVPQLIRLKHNNIKMSLNLKLLKSNVAEE